MTANLTITITSNDDNDTWEDVMKFIKECLSPSAKDVKLSRTPMSGARRVYDYTQELQYYKGLSGKSVVEVEHEVPTGYGAVVQSGSSSTLYTRLVSGGWISSATGTYHLDHHIQNLLGHGATVLFKGVEQ